CEKNSAHGRLHFHELFHPLLHRRVCGEQGGKGAARNGWHDKERVHALYLPQVLGRYALHGPAYLEQSVCKLYRLACHHCAVPVCYKLAVARYRPDYQKADKPRDDRDEQHECHPSAVVPVAAAVTATIHAAVHAKLHHVPRYR